ncbi:MULTISPECIES: hypothetical protein [Streptomyces]|uniref:Uncharacterized protein n=3 Tax=Streptomyces rimosus TaxID=1927 RepID=L8EUC2_STRR1|nr:MULTISPECIES: hypothetical protein [Streptomyces]KOG84166.1 hypothetical protein ADK78_00805 [Kitasatospora aureofaciens]MYT44917.1 hypothetical protein [Streptomyces sp. SID5471]KOT27946.1 hypothetical protein ADK84_37290 [Streptomyces sp. NRRL WC-3701]KOT42244.1 hypothetical protein ADK42_10055 [Streptomyces rimosus subsp. rimosus]KOT68542.1 hypothetical protein ADK44_00720 [Streptomyces rimosus subsp. rimosus]
MDRIARPPTQISPAQHPTRRLLAAGILGRRAGRTIATIRTADGTTGHITPRHQAAPLALLLTTAADRLAAHNPDTTLTPERLLTEAHVTVWDWHGTYTDTAPVRADLDALTRVLDELPLDGATRGEYATRLRLTASGVTL